MRLITVNGRLAQDVTPQLSRQGTQFIRFSIASQEYSDDKGSDGRPLPQWYQVTAFEPRLIALSRFLTKGKPVIVVGEYSNRIYQSQKTGAYGIDNNVIANNIFFEAGSERREGAVTERDGGQLSGDVARARVSGAVEEIPKATTMKLEFGNARGGVGSDAGDADDGLPF